MAQSWCSKKFDYRTWTRALPPEEATSLKTFEIWQAYVKKASCEMSSCPGDCPFHSVVVVGAGLAGLSAACQLQPTCPDVLLLEASERVGGRVQHVRAYPPYANPFCLGRQLKEY